MILWGAWGKSDLFKPYNDYTVEQLESSLLRKDMALGYGQWPTLLLYCLLDILPLFDKRHNDGPLVLLFNDIYAKRCNDIDYS